MVGSSLTAHAANPVAEEEKGKPKDEPFRYCLNTSTIEGQKLSIVEKVEIASKAGYQAIEPWIRELDQHVKDGGNLKDLGRRIQDSGLTVPSTIWTWSSRLAASAWPRRLPEPFSRPI